MRASLLIAVSVLLCSAGCGGSRTGDPTANRIAPFIAAPRTLIAACRRTAQAVGYPVACPTRVPRGQTAASALAPTNCRLLAIGPGGAGGCAKGWRGWVIGSSATSEGHLVLTASPSPLRNGARVVNGPAWYPQERVKPVARMTIHGWHIRAVFVPPDTNDGSAFANHVVLIWTVGGHSYAAGFHNVHGIQGTLELDRRLVDGMRLVAPPRTVSGAALTLALPPGWDGSVGFGSDRGRAAAWILATSFSIPSDAAAHEGLPSVPAGDVLVSVGDFPIDTPAQARWPRVTRLRLSHVPARRRWSTHVRFADRAVRLAIVFGSRRSARTVHAVNTLLSSAHG